MWLGLGGLGVRFVRGYLVFADDNMRLVTSNHA